MWKELTQWREDVLRRDGYKCVECGSTDKLEADHIKSFIAYPKLRLDISNGRTLCPDCHRKTHNYGVGVKKEVAIANCENNPLDREAWIALGKAMGWGEPIPCPVAGCKMGHHAKNSKNWRAEWHRFIDYLASGGSADDFFNNLLK